MSPNCAFCSNVNGIGLVFVDKDFLANSYQEAHKPAISPLIYKLDDVPHPILSFIFGLQVNSSAHEIITGHI